MNIKKTVILLIFLVAIACLISPVNAKLDGYVSKYDNTSANKLFVCISSDIGINSDNWKSTKYVTKRKAELNKVNKVVVTFNGYTPITIKKPVKGWKTYKYADAFENSFSVKNAPKSLKSKNYSIKLYDNKNKLIRNNIKSKLR